MNVLNPLEEKYEYNDEFNPNIIHDFTTRYVLFVTDGLVFENDTFKCSLMNHKDRVSYKETFKIIHVPEEKGYMFLDVDSYTMKRLVEYLSVRQITFHLKHINVDVYRTYYAIWHKFQSTINKTIH